MTYKIRISHRQILDMYNILDKEIKYIDFSVQPLNYRANVEQCRKFILSITPNEVTSINDIVLTKMIDFLDTKLHRVHTKYISISSSTMTTEQHAICSQLCNILSTIHEGLKIFNGVKDGRWARD